MSRTLGPTTEILMRRVRQEGGLAVDPDFAIEIYTRCEQIINAFTKRIITSDTLTVPKEKLLFNLQTEFSDAIEVLDLRASGRRIEKMDNLTVLFAYDVDGFRCIDGTRVEAWCPINRDLFLIYPGLASAGSLSIDYVKLLTIYTDFIGAYDTACGLVDEDVEMALKLAEIVLLIRFRQLTAAVQSVDLFTETYLKRSGKKI